MSTAEIFNFIEPLALPPFSALLLYGSYAREEADEMSDVDILQVTRVHRASYARGNVNFTCYTPEQLLTLAKNGAMFARHLVLEALPLFDPEQFMERLTSTYVSPKSYVNVYTEVVSAIPLIAIDEREFGFHTRQYASTASYLLRTCVYALAFESGAQSFSMKRIASMTGDSRPGRVLRALRERKSYDAFRSVINLLFELTDTRPFVREESLEALILNAFGVSELTIILGLRILAAGEPIEYPILRPEP